MLTAEYVTTVTDNLLSRGVFNTATLLAPFTLVWVTLNLAATNDPNEYAMWLAFYAAAHEVSTTELARHCLLVLANAEPYVRGDVVARARHESRALVAA
jgi:hypothetical protein